MQIQPIECFYRCLQITRKFSYILHGDLHRHSICPIRPCTVVCILFSHIAAMALVNIFLHIWKLIAFAFCPAKNNRNNIHLSFFPHNLLWSAAYCQFCGWSKFCCSWCVRWIFNYVEQRPPITNAICGQQYHVANINTALSCHTKSSLMLAECVHLVIGRRNGIIWFY